MCVCSSTCGGAESYPSSLYYVTPLLQEGLQDCPAGEAPPSYAPPSRRGSAILPTWPGLTAGIKRVANWSVFAWEFPGFNSKSCVPVTIPQLVPGKLGTLVTLTGLDVCPFLASGGERVDMSTGSWWLWVPWRGLLWSWRGGQFPVPCRAMDRC